MEKYSVYTTTRNIDEIEDLTQFDMDATEFFADFSVCKLAGYKPIAVKTGSKQEVIAILDSPNYLEVGQFEIDANSLAEWKNFYSKLNDLVLSVWYCGVVKKNLDQAKIYQIRKLSKGVEKLSAFHALASTNQTAFKFPMKLLSVFREAVGKEYKFSCYISVPCA